MAIAAAVEFTAQTTARGEGQANENKLHSPLISLIMKKTLTITKNIKQEIAKRRDNKLCFVNSTLCNSVESFR